MNISLLFALLLKKPAMKQSLFCKLITLLSSLKESLKPIANPPVLFMRKPSWIPQVKTVSPNDAILQLPPFCHTNRVWQGFEKSPWVYAKGIEG